MGRRASGKASTSVRNCWLRVEQLGRMDMLELEKCQQKSWGLKEKSHTIFGRYTEYLRGNT